MKITNTLARMGGAGDLAALLRHHSRVEVDRALRDGTIVRTARGRYAAWWLGEDKRTASRVDGVLSHRSAAIVHEWAVREVPPRPDVTFRRDRRLRGEERRLVVPHWSELHPTEVDGLVTTRRRTLIDCMRNLGLQDSLAIADSAIRNDDVTGRDLLAIARSTKGRGRTRIICVAEEATSRAANAFESSLRAIASGVPGLRLQAQHPVLIPWTGVTIHPDVVDPALKIAIEAESFEWHGTTAQLTRDCRRYNALMRLGWLVIRFSWYQVQFEPAYVRQTIEATVELARRVHGLSGRPANVA
jgi:very-short-patch-repair endonuclease